MERSVNQFAETVSIMPDPTPDRYQADTNPNIGEQIDRALHGVRDREVGVFPLGKGSDEENSAQEPNHLNASLYHRKIPDNSRAMKSAPDYWRGAFVKNWRGDRPKKTHAVISR
jgi:hypothetical protein